MQTLTKYLLNCFILLIPIFLWNIAFVKTLPDGYKADVFWKDIPGIVGIAENVLRIIVFVLPLIMVLSIETKIQKIGLWMYILGVIIYFLSWVVQMYFPDISWSRSMLGFTAPAYTTIIWFVGIGLIGSKSFFKIPYLSVIYIAISVLFVFVHSLHAYIVFQRL